ncbi:MAG TPA: hypothetical protein PLU52_11410 [Opitutaceae bacterium]|nr:hypothetical protein [Opitutaceae bacterium]
MAKRTKTVRRSFKTEVIWFVMASGSKTALRSRNAILKEAGLRSRYDFPTQKEAKDAAKAIKAKTGVPMKVAEGFVLFL